MCVLVCIGGFLVVNLRIQDCDLVGKKEEIGFMLLCYLTFQLMVVSFSLLQSYILC